MPLARIITHSVEAADPIIKQLKARGYTVETRQPGESEGKPADLEIVLETTNPADALSRATSLAKAADADVYIGAGTFRARRVDAPPPQRQGVLPVPSVEDTVNGVAAGLQNKRDLLAKALWEQRANLREARRLQRDRVRQEQERLASETQRSRAHSEEETGRLRAQHEERAPIQAAEAERQRIAAIEAERQRVAAAEAERQRLAEIEAREHAERERIAAQEAEAEYSQMAAAAEQESIEVVGAGSMEYPDAPTQQPQPAIAAPVESASVMRQAPPIQEDVEHRARVRGVPKRNVRWRSTRARSREWRAAVIVSSIFALLLMFAWRVVTRGPVSPLPSAVSTQPNLQQEVPFGGVTLTPPDNGLSGSLAPAAHSGGKILRPIAADFHGATGSDRAVKSSPSANRRLASRQSKASATEQKRTKRPTRTSKPRRAKDETAEDEVIIRHFTPKPTVAAPSEQKVSLKRYSDLDD